jgi:hypothetical protein
VNSFSWKRASVFHALFVLCLPAVTGCATYHLDLSRYPANQRVLYLHNFTNETFQADTNVELTEWVRREIHRRRNFTLADDRARAPLSLYAKVRVYRKEGRLYDNAREPVRFDLTVIARVRVRRNTEELLDAHDVGASIEYSSREGFTETEFGARQRLLRILAERIHNRLDKVFVDNTAAPPPPPSS